ncbi:hypothetical protein [Polaribacter staleyi]|uniref:hypothetical protein n=1 Tax=Polaribacter staleyi TaxID=2022337 RepID=UPI0031B9AC72
MKTMKTNYLKLGVLGLMMMVGTAMNAQQTSGDATQIDGSTAIGKIEDLSKSSVLNGTIRVIDNKGTKKFLQVKNGITLLTDTTPDGGIISTWQLGGTLTDNTYIDATGKAFALDGIKLLSPTLTAGAATTAATAATAATQSSHGGTGTGWTVLIRDEATGETQKLLATDLIATGRVEYTITANAETAITVTGLANGTAISKISVYRNGAKLRAGQDYSLTADDTITLELSAAAPNDWSTYIGDMIEVQWIY